MALVLAVIGIARTNPAWAGASTSPPQAAPQSGLDAVDLNAAQPMSIIVTGSGSYLIGGVCKFDANYIATDIKNQVDAEVPIAHSQKVPFTGKGNLFYPGCHVVHYKADAIVDQAKTEDGSWKVCFGKRPDIAVTSTILPGHSVDGSRIWAAVADYSGRRIFLRSCVAYGCLYAGRQSHPRLELHMNTSAAFGSSPRDIGSVQPRPFRMRLPSRVLVWHGRDLQPGCLLQGGKPLG